MPTRVTVLYNLPTLPAGHRDAESEHEVVYTVRKIAAILRKAGYEVTRLGAHVNPGRIVAGLKKFKPDVVFNLFEGVPAMSQTEAFAAGILEWMGVPYTGCPFQTMVIARDKPLTKRLLRGAGLPTPRFELVETLPAKPCRLGWPVIVKPSNQDASIGVHQTSVVTNDADYAQRVAEVMAEFGGPVLVEQFVDGREFHVGMMENPELTFLPPWEMQFPEAGPGWWPIVTYNAKWELESKDWNVTPCDYRPKIEPRVWAKVQRVAREAYRLLGCRDLVRIDFRVTPDGRPYVLEVNPNPDFSPIAGFADALEGTGLTHAGLAVQMVKNALARGAPKLKAPPRGMKIIHWNY
jgi:D-alanine-D-alanine ligase